MKHTIAAGVLFLIAAGLFLLSVRSFQEKGFLFNNAYIYASKQEREQMNKKPLYRQSAIVCFLLGITFVLIGIARLLGMDWIFLLVGITIVVTIVYAIVSSIRNEKR